MRHLDAFKCWFPVSDGNDKSKIVLIEKESHRVLDGNIRVQILQEIARFAEPERHIVDYDYKPHCEWLSYRKVKITDDTQINVYYYEKQVDLLLLPLIGARQTSVKNTRSVMSTIAIVRNVYDKFHGNRFHDKNNRMLKSTGNVIISHIFTNTGVSMRITNKIFPGIRATVLMRSEVFALFQTIYEKIVDGSVVFSRNSDISTSEKILFGSLDSPIQQRRDELNERYWINAPKWFLYWSSNAVLWKNLNEAVFTGLLDPNFQSISVYRAFQEAHLMSIIADSTVRTNYYRYLRRRLKGVDKTKQRNKAFFVELLPSTFVLTVAVGISSQNQRGLGSINEAYGIVATFTRTQSSITVEHHDDDSNSRPHDGSSRKRYSQSPREVQSKSQRTDHSDTESIETPVALQKAFPRDHGIANCDIENVLAARPEPIASSTPMNSRRNRRTSLATRTATTISVDQGPQHRSCTLFLDSTDCGSAEAVFHGLLRTARYVVENNNHLHSETTICVWVSVDLAEHELFKGIMRMSFMFNRIDPVYFFANPEYTKWEDIHEQRFVFCMSYFNMAKRAQFAYDNHDQVTPTTDILREFIEAANRSDEPRIRSFEYLIRTLSSHNSPLYADDASYGRMINFGSRSVSQVERLSDYITATQERIGAGINDWLARRST